MQRLERGKRAMPPGPLGGPGRLFEDRSERGHEVIAISGVEFVECHASAKAERGQIPQK
jgi:hypothetical protein